MKIPKRCPKCGSKLKNMGAKPFGFGILQDELICQNESCNFKVYGKEIYYDCDANEFTDYEEYLEFGNMDCEDPLEFMIDDEE